MRHPAVIVLPGSSVGERARQRQQPDAHRDERHELE